MAMDLKRYENVLRKQTGKAVRPYRADGYVNAINRYGTSKDDTEQYFYNPEPVVDDSLLEMFYENNGLFAKIIDTPAEEAVKHGFSIDGIEDEDLIRFYESAIDELDWEETAMTALKWARLFGGSLAVMLINDGHALEEPLDWRHIRSIDDIVVFDRSIINPDRTSMYKYDPQDPFCTRGSRLGTPEWYEINGPQGAFIVHDSRCLTFRNGVLPYNAQNEIYQLWGVPEYVRISRAVRNAEIAHESAPKMLSKSVQPVYKMKDLAMELATEEGEDKVLRRLQAIDMARGLLNSITIDSEGEDYSFQSFGFAGVSDVIDSSCNWLSALTNIPQTILFGRSPAGMNATGEADFENYYNFVERIQKRMLRSNLRYLLSVIFTAGKHTGEVKKIPDINVSFNPLWSMSDTEEAQLESTKLQNEMTRASIAQTYIQNEVITPEEVRVQLGKEDDFDVESMLDDMTEEELIETAPKGQQEGMGGEDPMAAMMGGGGAPQVPQQAPAAPQNEDETNPYYAVYGNSPETAPEATKLPQDMEQEELDHEDEDTEDVQWITAKNGVHIPLDESGKAVGGPLKGESFTEAKSEDRPSDDKPDSSSSVIESITTRKPVQGKDISGSYDGEKDIKSVIHAQGFDGLPRLVSQEEFDKAVKASSFIAQRSYSASSQEILDAYQDQLYNGEWYVDCTKGGAQYGQGMYCAADYTGTLSDGIKSEMEHYSGLYKEAYRGEAWFAELAKKDWKSEQKKKDEESIKKYGEPTFGTRQYGAPTKEEWDVWAYMKSEGIRGYSLPEDKKKIWEQSLENHHSEAITELFVEGLNEFNDTYKGNSKIETFTLDSDAKVIKYSDIPEERTKAGIRIGIQKMEDSGNYSNQDIELMREYASLDKSSPDYSVKAQEIGKKLSAKAYNDSSDYFRDGARSLPEDNGVFASLLGYDAINAEGHGKSGSYTVILNRSKCIFLADDKRTDAEDGSMITFKLGENGKINAIRDGEVIGWVMTQESGEPEHEDVDSQDPGGLVKRWSTPDYQPPFYEISDSEKWLVKDIEPLLSFTDDVNSLEWADDELKRRIRAVGVIVVDKNGKILSGIRKGGDGDNFNLLGGPGGHVEPHESLEDAAIRETYEEFGIVAKDPIFLSLGDYEEESGMIPAIFLCTEWTGRIYPVDGEMENIRFRTIDDIMSHNLFAPFKSSLEILQNVLTNDENGGIIELTEDEDARFDGNRGNLARATIAKAISLGFDDQDPKNKKDTLNQAIIYLQNEKGITQQDILDEWKNERKESKDRQAQRSAQKGAEQSKREQENKKDRDDLIAAKQEAKNLLPLWIAQYPNKWQLAQSTRESITQGEVYKRAFQAVRLSPANPFPPSRAKYKKHVLQLKEKAFAGMSQKQYDQYVCDLASSRVGKNVSGFTRNQGDIMRYDVNKNVLVIVDGNGKFVKSCHELWKANYTNLVPGGIKGRAYYEFQKMVFGWR